MLRVEKLPSYMLFLTESFSLHYRNTDFIAVSGPEMPGALVSPPVVMVHGQQVADNWQISLGSGRFLCRQ